MIARRCWEAAQIDEIRIQATEMAMGENPHNGMERGTLKGDLGGTCHL